jgi:hypothetical protein
MSEPEQAGVVAQLEAVRTALRQQDLPDAARAEMEQALDGLEQEFSAVEPPDPSALVTLLQGWEAQLEVEHPLLARVITEALHRLTAMGI